MATLHSTLQAAPVSLTYVLTLPTLLSAIATISLSLFIVPLLSYRIKAYRKKFSYDKKVRFNIIPGAILHTIIVCTLIFIALLTGSVSIWESLAESKSPIGFITMQISAGFFFGDMMVYLGQKPLRDIKTLLHHAASLFSILLILLYEGRWMILVLARVSTEISTPFVHLRWILAETNESKNSPLSVFTAIGMTTTFLLFRVLAVPAMWLLVYLIELEETGMNTYFPSASKWFAYVMMGILDLLNTYWSYKVVRGFVKWIKTAFSSSEDKKD
ncbi:PREDICTED: transmembrane protein 56-like [Amphimedon queenslandica]|uniref:TLC domain-containing protein n=1 Tax=Amphimedon queenslandica TaxID=400682 RepID=A0A1X7U6K8_AMPQE|nr:PREDICTED: transmembrane protein 56-like [Amphimedon queenslandica]|eukprot:XP_011405905.1 PREDICTED: transmembrane protein 56-like [Amphimedon queenslandica]